MEDRRRVVRGDVPPDVRDRAGFSGAYLFRDRDSEVTMSITFWTDAETAAVSGEDVQQHLDKWEELTGRVPTIETFEVVVSTERP